METTDLQLQMMRFIEDQINDVRKLAKESDRAFTYQTFLYNMLSKVEGEVIGTNPL